MRLATTRPDPGGRRLAFIVTDTGIGIAERDMAMVVTPFGQVENALSRRYPGTGLGLPLARRFAEAMGGRFALDSELGRGTTVTIELPVAADEEAEIAAAADAAAPVAANA